MKENSNKPIYNLEERTFQFAKEVRIGVKELPESIELKKIFSATEAKSK
jgi:hypothetical protein